RRLRATRPATRPTRMVQRTCMVFSASSLQGGRGRARRSLSAPLRQTHGEAIGGVTSRPTLSSPTRTLPAATWPACLLPPSQNATLPVTILDVVGLALLLLGLARPVAAPHRDFSYSQAAPGCDPVDRARSCLRPVGRHVVVLVGLGLPVAVGPGIVAEGRCVLELPFGDTSHVGAELSIVFEGRPGDRVVAVTQAYESAKAHHSIGNTAGDLVDHEVVDLTDFLAVHVVDVRAFDVLARDQLVVGVNG